MVDISSLHVGDMVQIVDHWVDFCHQNPDGKMDKYLGTVMTVRSISIEGDPYVRMEEDYGRPERRIGWAWYPASINHIVYSLHSSDEFDSDIDLSKLLMGGN